MNLNRSILKLSLEEPKPPKEVCLILHTTTFRVWRRNVYQFPLQCITEFFVCKEKDNELRFINYVCSRDDNEPSAVNGSLAASLKYHTGDGILSHSFMRSLPCGKNPLQNGRFMMDACWKQTSIKDRYIFVVWASFTSHTNTNASSTQNNNNNDTV
jgi:hypothetical protein